MPAQWQPCSIVGCTECVGFGQPAGPAAAAQRMSAKWMWVCHRRSRGAIGGAGSSDVPGARTRAAHTHPPACAGLSMAAQLSLARCSSRVISSRQVVAPRRLSAALQPARRHSVAARSVVEVEASNSAKHGEGSRRQRGLAQCARLQGMGGRRSSGRPRAAAGGQPNPAAAPARMPRRAPRRPAEKKSKKEEDEDEWEGADDDGLNPQQASARRGPVALLLEAHGSGIDALALLGAFNWRVYSFWRPSG